METKGKVILGMSGGTDSSMSALLLQEQGYTVVGVTFRFYDTPETPIHIADAQALAAKIGIEHHVYDHREAFREHIVGYFIEEYMAGRTPSPCVKCNNEFKFKLLAEIADSSNAHYIATGHYVQTETVEDTTYITSGADPDKDQSFFLWNLPQHLVRRVVFPLGKYLKSEVRQLAANRGFVRAATKKDSLGVCFCSDDYRTFLTAQLPKNRIRRGEFYNTKGEMVGVHQGYPFYTVGQRRGLGVQFNRAQFVKAILPDYNRVILADKTEMYQVAIQLKGCHYYRLSEVAAPALLVCKIRYRKQATLCTLELNGTDGIVHLQEPLDAVAPGQTAVFYIGNRVVGGGWIVA